jgi:glycosyltransferase involved in cell wall biosynthesis
LKDLPTYIDGIDDIKVLIVDDGSSDKTGEIALKNGAHYVVRHNRNRGLPMAVNTGIRFAIENDADILVNTDADNQYKGEDIISLVQPLVLQRADYVYGERQIDKISHFSPLKKLFQAGGAVVISLILGFRIYDGASGFRAINREAMRRIFLLADFASPLESLIQARMKKLAIEVVPIEVNETHRVSRIVKSIPIYVTKSASIILDNILIYRPLQVFFSLGVAGSLFGILIWIVRYFLVISDTGSSHLTLLIASIFLFMAGMQFMVLGLLARISRANRLINEQVLYILHNQK